MTRDELKRILDEEKQLYLGSQTGRTGYMKKSGNRRYVIWQYLVSFRLCQYWKSLRENTQESGIKRRWAKMQYHRFDKQRNRLSERCGIEIGINSHVGAGIDIWHGGIVVNGSLGDGCVLHGNIIIGNKGIGKESETPVIGDRVDIGAGACVIGGVVIASDSVIGAGAVVTKSFDEKGSVLAGVPARVIGVKS